MNVKIKVNTFPKPLFAIVTKEKAKILVEAYPDVYEYTEKEADKEVDKEVDKETKTSKK